VESRKKILILSYFFYPYPGVGAKRMTYWFKRLKENHDVVVYTAIPQTTNDSRIKYIQPEEVNNVLSKFVKDEGVRWLNPLKKELSNEKINYDYVIISGGPFMHMLITQFIKKNYDAKIILDFRDPFYANPRFASSFIKDKIKLYFQNMFLKYADKVITVNNYCADLIDFTDITIIDNGFDENISVEQEKLSVEKKKLITIGRVDSDFEMLYFNQLISSQSELHFYYYGKNIETFVDSKSQHLHHPIDYDKVLKEIFTSDICILFTTGEPFESTTKIFDYLAFNKKILIITDGKPETGSLHNITKDYPNVRWAENNLEDIGQKLNELLKTKPIPFDTAIYSRAYGFEKLLKLIEE